jgi:hypothetical protein
VERDIDKVKGIVDIMTDGNHAGYSQGLPMYTGIRSRSPGLGGHSPLEEQYSGEIDRSRIIMFHPALSTWTLFLPDKKEFYAETLTKIQDLFGISEKVMTPIVHGGQVYVEAAEHIANGLLERCFDGKGWEAQVGILMNDAFSPYFTNMYGHRVLPSGITLTSWIDTVGSLWILSKMNVKYEMAVVLGDDVNVFSEKDQSSGHMEGIMEHQPEDEDIQFMLGVSYARDPWQPRIQGVKLMADRGDKAIHLPLSPGFYVDDIVKGTHDERTTELWYGLSLGRFGPRTLIDAIRSIPGHEFKGPDAMIEELADIAFDMYSWDEIISWRDELFKKGKEMEVSKVRK